MALTNAGVRTHQSGRVVVSAARPRSLPVQEGLGFARHRQSLGTWGKASRRHLQRRHLQQSRPWAAFASSARLHHGDPAPCSSRSSSRGGLPRKDHATACRSRAASRRLCAFAGMTAKKPIPLRKRGFLSARQEQRQGGGDRRQRENAHRGHAFGRAPRSPVALNRGKERLHIPSRPEPSERLCCATALAAAHIRYGPGGRLACESDSAGAKCWAVMHLRNSSVRAPAFPHQGTAVGRVE